MLMILRNQIQYEHLLVPLMRFGVVLEKHTNIGIKLYENIEISGVSEINFNSSYKLKMTLKRRFSPQNLSSLWIEPHQQKQSFPGLIELDNSRLPKKISKACFYLYVIL